MAASHTTSFRFGKVSHFAFMPTRRAPTSNVYDLRCAHDVVIHPYAQAIVPTDLWITLPNQTVAIISQCSDWKLTEVLHVQYTLISAEHTPTLGIIIYNNTDKRLDIHRSRRIAQIEFR